MEKHLLTAGGRIKCLRCTAKSSRFVHPFTVICSNGENAEARLPF